MKRRKCCAATCPAQKSQKSRPSSSPPPHTHPAPPPNPLTAVDHLLPDNMQPLLNPIDAVGYQPEVVPPHRLLAGVEDRVVRRDDLQRAAGERGLQRLAVGGGPDGRRHDVLRGGLEVGVPWRGLCWC